MIITIIIKMVLADNDDIIMGRGHCPPGPR